jgi:hypothetical protein
MTLRSVPFPFPAKEAKQRQLTCRSHWPTRCDPISGRETTLTNN